MDVLSEVFEGNGFLTLTFITERRDTLVIRGRWLGSGCSEKARVGKAI